MNVRFSSVTQSCPTLCDPVDCSTPGFPAHHQLLELAQTHVHRVGDAIPFSSCLQSFRASGSFLIIQLFTSGGQGHYSPPKYFSPFTPLGLAPYTWADVWTGKIYSADTVLWLFICWLWRIKAYCSLIINMTQLATSVRPHRRQPTRLPCPWDFPGRNAGVGCHFLLQCMNYINFKKKKRKKSIVRMLVYMIMESKAFSVIYSVVKEGNIF